MVGLRYFKFNDSGYTETGTARRAMTVSKKSIDKIERGYWRKSFAYVSDKRCIVIMPEEHGFVSYDLKGKAQKVEARLNGALAPMPKKTSKPDK